MKVELHEPDRGERCAALRRLGDCAWGSLRCCCEYVMLTVRVALYEYLRYILVGTITFVIGALGWRTLLVVEAGQAAMNHLRG